jgi:hypothetical protein
MKKRREFDITLKVQEDKNNSEFALTLSLASVFKDYELPEYFKTLPKIENEIEGENKQKFVEMIYNFLKNNLDVEKD